MKKLLMLSAATILLSACGHRTVAEAYRGYDDEGCNYYNGENCNRNEAPRPQPQQAPAPMPQPQVMAPAPMLAPAPQVVYVQQKPAASQVMYVQASSAPVNEVVYVEKKTEPKEVVIVENKPIKKTVTAVITDDANSPCEPTVREEREPVEIVYKKTTYTTVYEPKTTSAVSYEKEPYKGEALSNCVECADDIK